MGIGDKIENLAWKAQESLKKPIIKTGWDVYNYEDKENKDVLLEQRKKYVIKALEKVLEDKSFIELMMKHQGKPGEKSVVRWITEKIYPILSEDCGVNKNTSPKEMKDLGKEYNEIAIHEIVEDYLGSEDEGKIFKGLGDRLQ